MERLPAAEEVPDPAIGTGRMERRLTQEDLRKLSHHLGSGESRRKIRYVARQQSHLRRSSYFCPELVSAYIRKASQVPFYVPPSDRPLLYAIRASTIDPIAQPGELRREIPYVARQESHLRLSLYLHRGPVSAYISKASQVPFYVPPSDRPLLYAVRESTINPIAQPGLLRLPLELRQKIYGYLLPYNDKRIFQTRDRDRHRDGEIPNFAVKCARDADGRPVYMWGRCGGYEPLKAHTAIMRINKQLHNETQTYLFRGCTIKIHVDEVGYSFLEHDYGGPFVQQRLDSDGNNLLNYRGRDRYTKWYQTFVSNFDFTQLKKLIISIEAPQYDNPEGVVQIRWSMMALCDILRKCSKIQHIEVEPQSMEYRYSYYNHRCLRGSYFMWEWDKNVLPTFQSLWQHRPRFQGEAIWEGRLSHLVFDKVPDLALVLEPLETLQNVAEATIKLPPTAHSSIIETKRKLDEGCGLMRGDNPSAVARKIDSLQARTIECWKRLKVRSIRDKIKKAKRSMAKDLWYMSHCETGYQEFTDHGEQGYESSDDPEW